MLRAQLKNALESHRQSMNRITVSHGIEWRVEEPVKQIPKHTIRCTVSGNALAQIRELYGKRAFNGSLRKFIETGKGIKETPTPFNIAFQSASLTEELIEIILDPDVPIEMVVIEKHFSYIDETQRRVMESQAAILATIKQSDASVTASISQATSSLSRQIDQQTEVLTSRIDNSTDKILLRVDSVGHQIEAMRQTAEKERKSILQQIIKGQELNEQHWQDLFAERKEAKREHQKLAEGLQELNGKLSTFSEEAQNHQKSAHQKHEEIVKLMSLKKANTSQETDIKESVDKMLFLFSKQMKQQQIIFSSQQQIQQIVEKVGEQQGSIARELGLIEDLPDENEGLSSQDKAKVEKVNADVQAAHSDYQFELFEINSLVKQCDSVFSFQEEQAQLFGDLSRQLAPQGKSTPPENTQLLSMLNEMFEHQKLAQQQHEKSLDELKQSFQSHQQETKNKEQLLLEKLDALFANQQAQKETMIAVDGFLQHLQDDPANSPIAGVPINAFTTEEANYFCQQLIKILTQFYRTMKDVQEGNVRPQEGATEKIAEGARFISEFIPIPYLQLAVDLLGAGAKKANEMRERAHARTFDQYIDDDNAIIRAAVFRITERYQRQIQKLTKPGIKELAKCALKRIFDFIISQNASVMLSLTPQEKINYLVQGVEEGNLHNIKNTSVETKDKKRDKDWSAEGLFKRSGIQLQEDGSCFIKKENMISIGKSKEESKQEKYGFRLIAQSELIHFMEKGYKACNDKELRTARENGQTEIPMPIAIGSPAPEEASSANSSASAGRERFGLYPAAQSPTQATEKPSAGQSSLTFRKS
jgi:hypothetical protein